MQIPKNNSCKDVLTNVKKDTQVDKNRTKTKTNNYQQTQFEKVDNYDVEKEDLKNVAWVGTSLSKALDVDKLEKDTQK